MDNYLIPSALLLIATNVSFAVLAWHWRAQAKRSEAHALQVGLDMVRSARATHEAAWEEGRRHTLGTLYRVVARAEREGRDPFAALRAVSAESDQAVKVLPSS